ncbi:MAG: hypothetical protein IKL42_01890 [Clostridia bacterium]|nr:hypothetical protein [Clostridia bacterium]MBR3576134.1 hypothetical protein [Clostridia bacterium]
MKLKNLTLGAVVSALIIALMYLAALIQTGTVAIYYVISILLMVLVVEAGFRTSVVSYVATSIILAFIAPDKGMAIAYTMFIGLHPVLKALFERPHKLIRHWMLKLPFFVIATVSGMFVFSAFVAGFDLKMKILIGIGVVFAMCVYDFLLSFGITYYNKYLSDRIFKSRKP